MKIKRRDSLILVRTKNVNIITILIDFPFFQDYNVDIKEDLFYSWEKVMAMYF